jgi:hypothetical protein
MLMVLPAADTRSRTAEVLHEKLVQVGCRADVAGRGVRRGGHPGGDGPAEELDRDPDLGRRVLLPRCLAPS